MAREIRMVVMAFYLAAGRVDVFLVRLRRELIRISDVGRCSQ